MAKNYNHGKLHIFLRNTFLSFMSRVDPKLAISIIFRRVLNKKMDWDNPKDFNERVNWLKIHGDIELWARLTDKYEVRGYIKEKGLEDILVKLYGVWDRAEDIDFDSLPNSFVMKTTNGCNTVLLVEDKSKIDIKKTRALFKQFLKEPMGYATVEPHYFKIKPRIIAEEMLVNDNPQSTSLVDYKFICLNSEPHMIMLCADRVIRQRMSCSFYNMNWEYMPEQSLGQHAGNVVRLDKPKTYNQMIEVCRVLAKDHPQVRVDLYEAGGHIYFGEMTFTFQGGYIDYITPEKLREMGDLILLPQK
jgi:hypothetical protein